MHGQFGTSSFHLALQGDKFPDNELDITFIQTKGLCRVACAVIIQDAELNAEVGVDVDGIGGALASIPTLGRLLFRLRILSKSVMV